MRRKYLLSLILCLTPAAWMPAATEGQSPKPLQLPDILAWKHIDSPQVSNDGGWFAYKLVPNDGDAEVVIRNLNDGSERKFPIGELPTFDPNAGAPPPVLKDVLFSDDSKWLAFTVYPTGKEGKALRKARKPLQNKVTLIELASGKKTEFDKIRKFVFSGEMSTVLALHRYQPVAAGPAPEPAATAGKPADDKPTGSDLILHELSTGAELNLGNVSEFAFPKSGRWVAWLVDAQDQLGNGLQARNLATGTTLSLDSAKAVYKGLSWTERGDALASMRGVEDKGFEQKRYSLVAFSGFDSASPARVVYDPSKDSTFSAGMTISPNRPAAWMADLSAVTFGVLQLKAKKPEPKADAKVPDEKDKPDLVVWNWRDRRLPSMQQVQENRDKNFSYLCAYRPAEQKFVRLADEALRDVTVTPDSKFGIGTDVREYEREANLDGRRFQDVYSVDLANGKRSLALRKARWTMPPSPDQTRMLYYQDGNFFSYDIANATSTNLTKDAAATFWDAEDDHNVSRPPTRVIGWSKDSRTVLLTDNWDIWKASAESGSPVNLTGNGKREKIRYRLRFRLDPDEKGIDLSQPMYVGAYGELTKKGGIGVIEPDKTGIRMLEWGDAAYGQVLKAKNAPVYLYSRETTQEPPNFHLAKSTPEGGPKVTDLNPQQKNFLWPSGVKVVDYVSDKGDKLQGTLYLPANYQPGKTYPMIVYIYEKLSQATNQYPQPGFNGFSVSAYTSNGYAVLEPDIVYKVNDPGMSAVWCILPAVKAAIGTGVVDAKRVGLHGHSWGGYQTAFTVTQTNMFKAAIAGAPLTDMIAMYNAIYWNTGGGNMAIFESSQGRFTGGQWENTEAYIRNSPVYHAKNVTTPLLILHNDKDGAVDHTQGIEYFNTLRRLDKPVVMLEYKGENHGLRKPENKKDYTVRMKEFWDHFLMDKPAPKWWEEGVPVIQMKEHLEEREVTSPGAP